MKKLAFASIVLVFLLVGMPAFAEDENGNGERAASGLAVINVSLERIWTHRLGFVVEYRVSGNRLGRAYIPMDWFAGGDYRGELITLPVGNSWPSMSVFFRDGEFSQVRLNVHRSPFHQTWGSVPMTVNLDNHFEGIEGIELQF